MDYHNISRWVTQQSYPYTLTTAENEARVRLETGEMPTQRWAERLDADQGWLRPLP